MKNPFKQYCFTGALRKYLKEAKVDRGSINVILDIGAKDCKESLTFTKIFPNSKVYSFECNPEALQTCRNNAEKSDRIQLIEKAISCIDGEREFYIPDFKRNSGAASLYKPKSNLKYWGNKSIITVDSIRMDTFIKEENIKNIDWVWIDVQGAEVEVLESFGECLKNVNNLYIEADIVKGRYFKMSNKHDIINFLKGTGFELEMVDEYGPWNTRNVHLIFKRGSL